MKCYVRNCSIIVKFFFILSVLAIFSLPFSTFSYFRKPKTRRIVCRKRYDLDVYEDISRQSIRQSVLRHFPWATETEFVPSSSFSVAVDRRNEAVMSKGYFVMGYDNFGVHSNIPKGYDFYVKFSNNNVGSHFFQKPTAMRIAISGCQKHVRFLYKDADVVLKNHLKFWFHKYRLVYQEEFHNRSANAGLILGRSSLKVKKLLAMWDAGHGLGENVEQDQTVLRALIAEGDRDFLAVPPNMLGRHVHSAVINREDILMKEQLRKSPLILLMRLVIIGIMVRYIVSYKVHFMGHSFSEMSTTNATVIGKVETRSGSVGAVLLAGWLAVFDFSVRNPMIFASFISHKFPVNAAKYHSSHQIIADDLMRVWTADNLLIISTTTESFALRNLFFIDPGLLVSVLDILYFFILVVPLYWGFPILSLIALQGHSKLLLFQKRSL